MVTLERQVLQMGGAILYAYDLSDVIRRFWMDRSSWSAQSVDSKSFLLYCHKLFGPLESVARNGCY